ncbi:C-X-C motif chemokine 10 Small-inducible cytokine B10 Precursor [Channa argus]|uniref:C-X-C motif chemokine 10 Small-inducible cytokine B10 n=1 Tax=Channa argus TaxID=215402 RepID=A0A6G1Q6M4_CHAAH|nr:C-X-C motif chemokine 10 Small-inducible cytokine B10 Precursor [Channa argus]KAK2899908.1 hypothetical protein Q8A73_013037 [Channa argus]
MKPYILLIFGTLFVIANGLPPISRDFNNHCRCLQVESRIIPSDSLRSIKLIPEGHHCPETEVIAGLTTGEKICLNPQSSWVKKLIQFVLEKQLHQKGKALPKNQD